MHIVNSSSVTVVEMQKLQEVKVKIHIVLPCRVILTSKLRMGRSNWYIDYPIQCVLLFEITRCNRILRWSLTFANKSLIRCLDNIEHRWLCLVNITFLLNSYSVV